METEKFEAVAEALLFTMGGSITLKDLAAVTEIEEKEVKKKMTQLMDKYKAEDRGIKIIALEDAYQMCTKPEMYEYLIRLTHQPKKHHLTDVMLETLSIIAYKQPVTRSEIEQIRGVSSDHAVNRLLEYHLIEEAGRLDAPGRPILFATTEDFLRTFGVGTMEELPVIRPDMVEEFKEEAEEEVQLNIPV